MLPNTHRFRNLAITNLGACFSFKAYFTRWIADSTKRAPWLLDEVQSLLLTSAQAAAKQCDGGSDGVTCGEHWTAGSVWDSTLR